MAILSKEKTWGLSTVNFVLRESENPCEKGAMILEGVGDSYTKHNEIVRNPNRNIVVNHI